MIIGIDMGGVCSRKSVDYEGHGEYHTALDMPGCAESLRELKRNGHTLILISFCGRSRAAVTRSDLEPLGIFDEMYFVRDKHEKGRICDHVGAHFMIDDRKDVLDRIPAQTQCILFDPENPDAWRETVRTISQAEPWERPRTRIKPKLLKWLTY